MHWIYLIHVSQFELNYWNKWTFPRHSNLLRCTCMKRAAWTFFETFLFVFLLGLESIIFHYTFKATQGLIVSRFCVQASKTFSLAWQHKFFSALFTITQKVNKDIKYPDKTLKGKCVCSLCTASQLSGGFSSTGVERAEQRGGVSAGRTEQKHTGQSCLLYVDLEQQTKSRLSLIHFFACLDWSFHDH